MKYIDMHTHSTASDGSMTPAELVKHAKLAGLSALAITDHDTLEGLDEAVEAGLLNGIEIIRGVEIGVEYKPEMHILGYFFNDEYRKLQPLLDKLRENRENRNPKIITKLKELGFDITYEEVVKEAKGNVVARPHFAKVLMEKGYVGSIAEAFDKYLSAGKPAYFKKDKLTPLQGVAEIRKAGGMPVLAHPMFLNLEFREMDELLAEMKEGGLAGIEVYYSQQDGEKTRAYEKLAKKHGLFMTGGSDFHGRFKPDIRIGFTYGARKIPYELLEKMRAET